MKLFIRQSLMAMAVLLGSTGMTKAADGDTFTAKSTEGIEMTFKVISEADKTCQLGNGYDICLTDNTVAGSMTIPASPNGYLVTMIGKKAFYMECTSLTTVSLPSTVKIIGDYAFYGCSALTSVTLPDGLEEIGHDAFGETGLTSIALPASLTYIGSGAFSFSQLTEVTIPGSVTTLFSGAFSNCEKLVKATIGEGITVIPSSLFSYCVSLTTVSLPLTLRTIEHSAFSSTESLTELKVPEGVTAIYEATFYNSSLKKIWLPSTLTTMKKVFQGCNVEEAVIAEGATDISYWFQDCTQLKSISIPASVTTMTETFNGCTSLEKITVAAGNKTFDSRDDCNAVIETATNTLVRACRTTNIPATVTAIGDYAYNGVTGLGDFDLPKQVTKIGNYAFCASDLSTINLHNNLQSIGVCAFQETQLTSVALPDNLEYLSSGVLNSCKKLEHVTLGKNLKGIPTGTFADCSALKELEIPDGMIYISRNAFYKSGIENLFIPASVTSIFESAFENCHNIKEMVIEGSDDLVVYKYGFYGSWMDHLTFLTTYYTIQGCGQSAFQPKKISFQAYYTENIRYGSSVIHADSYDPFIGIRDEWTPYFGSHDNYAVPEGLEAYIVTGVSDGKAQLKKVSSINRDQGVLLHLVDCTKATATIKASRGDVLRYEAVTLDDSQVTDYSCENLLVVPPHNASAYNSDENIVQFLFNGEVFKQTELDTAIGMKAYFEASKVDYGKYDTLSLSVASIAVKGDADGNGKVEPADITFIEDLILKGKFSSQADVNKDKKVNAADIVEVVKIIKAYK